VDPALRDTFAVILAAWPLAVVTAWLLGLDEWTGVVYLVWLVVLGRAYCWRIDHRLGKR
jgi:hypothetical protein